MAKFRDAEGRDWPLFLTTDLIKEVRRLHDINLADLDGQMYTRLADDPVPLVAILWILCEEDAKRREVTPKEFGKALVGDAIESAVDALVEAITDFFPTRRRSLLRAAHAKTKTARENAYDLAMSRLNDPTMEARFNEAMAARMDADIQEALTRLSGPTNSAGLSATTQVPKVSENSGELPKPA